MKKTGLWLVLLAFAATSITAQEGGQVQPAEKQQQPEVNAKPTGVEQNTRNVQPGDTAVTEQSPEVGSETVILEEGTESRTELSPEEEAQIDRAIDEAMGRETGVSESSGVMEEEWVQEPPLEKEETVPLEETVQMEEAVPQEELAPKRSHNHHREYREVQTLMKGSGGYGAIDFGFTKVNGLNTLQMGARAAWIVGHGFGLGIAGTGFTSDFTPVGEDYYAISGGYGGLLMEPIIMGWFPVNIALPVVIGGGGLASYATNSDPWNYDNVDPTFGEYATFFAAEAGVELQFNLVRFFRFTLFGNYRWTTQLDMKPMYGLGVPSSYYVRPYALEGWTVGIRFKFGSF